MLIVELQPAAVSHSLGHSRSHLLQAFTSLQLRPGAALGLIARRQGNTGRRAAAVRADVPGHRRHRLVFSDDYFLLNLPDSCLIDR